jgi:hypothetical protein
MLTRCLDKLLARQVLPSKRPCRPAAVGSASGAKLALRSPHRGRPTREPHFIRCRTMPRLLAIMASTPTI